MTRRTITERGKAPLHLLLMPCLAEVAKVLDHGNRKPGRGPFNWRKSKVREGDMIGAALRHISAPAAGQRIDSGSKQRHYAHAIARLLIAMDADDHGNLIPAHRGKRK